MYIPKRRSFDSLRCATVAQDDSFSLAKKFAGGEMETAGLLITDESGPHGNILHVSKSRHGAPRFMG